MVLLKSLSLALLSVVVVVAVYVLAKLSVSSECVLRKRTVLFKLRKFKEKYFQSN